MPANMRDVSSRKEEPATIGKVLDTPITRIGFTWFPITQIILWFVFFNRAAKRKPSGRIWEWCREGLSKMAVMLGSEWGHNLAHLVASNWIGKPMDEFRIQAGMPRCIYYQINDSNVTPRQHIIRALGGPLFNLLMVPVTAASRWLFKPGTIARETAKTAYQTNLFLLSVSLLPIPGIDGGPILKWGLVDQGVEIEEADRAIQKVNGPLAGLLVLGSGWAFLKKKNLLGIFSGVLALIAWSVHKGWIKEEEMPI